MDVKGKYDKKINRKSGEGGRSGLKAERGDKGGKTRRVQKSWKMVAIIMMCFLREDDVPTCETSLDEIQTSANTIDGLF